MPRLFYAIWPDDTAKARLSAHAQELAKRLGGRPVPADNIHLTLAFLGTIADERVAEAMAVQVKQPSLALSTDFLGSFRGARVAWAGIEPIPDELVTLYHLLAAGLHVRGFQLEERRFVPHLTLVRKIRDLQPRTPMQPVKWVARSVQLMRTEVGTGRYSRLGGWRLR